MIALVLSFLFVGSFILGMNNTFFGILLLTPFNVIISFIGIAVIALPLKLIAEYKKNN